MTPFRHRFTFGLSLCGIAASLLFVAILAAEDVPGGLDTSQPSQNRPELPGYLPEKPDQGFVLPPAPKIPPVTPGARLFTLKRVVFEGNTVLSQDALQPVAAPFIGQAVGVAELEELRQRLTRAYVDRGLINSGAVIRPGQRVDEGVIVYTIEEGTLDQIRVAGQGRLHAEYLKKRLWPDPAKPFDTLLLQERFQLLLQDPLIDRINGRIEPGARPGEARLDLDVTRARPYGMAISLDNHRPPSTGAERLRVAGWVRNLSGWGDVLDASFGLTKGADELALGYAIPITYQDTRLAVRYSRSDSAVIEEPLDAVDVESESESLDLSLTHPLINDLQRRLEVGLTLSVKQNQTYLLGRQFSFSPGADEGQSRVTVLRLIQSFVHRTANHSLALRSTVSWGVDLFGPTIHTPDLPDGQFVAWLGQVQAARRLGVDGGQIVVRGDVQVAEDRLLSLEQFAVGGANTVRGYRENALVRDSGCAVSVEWRYPLVRRQASPGPSEVLQLVPFMDYGQAWNKGEGQSDNKLHSAGLGLIYTPNRRLSAELYWARDLAAAALDKRENLQDQGLHFRIEWKVF